MRAVMVIKSDKKIDLFYKTAQIKIVPGVKADGADLVDSNSITAVITTFNDPDVVGDIIMETAFDESLANFKLSNKPLPMMLQHDRSAIPGIWTEFTKISGGIVGKGRLLVTNSIGQNAKDLIEAGVIQDVSIGFRGEEYEYIDDGYSVRFIKADLREVSLVVYPANKNANILPAKDDQKSDEDETDEQQILNAFKQINDDAETDAIKTAVGEFIASNGENYA